MKNPIAISARGLGKRYMIGSREDRPTVFGRLRRGVLGRADKRELWALRGLDLEIERGEIFGVIGPNGAGKSTLLLLLAGILAPSAGSLTLSGRADPFFQLAAGLRPGLTVRDNFALCAALLGMPQAELKRRLPAMLEFSGLADHLYCRYGELSAGMAARLPFSVAIHADLDIIVVDEMLAVGDRAFQAQCIKAFKDLAARGKTLVLVSHTMDFIEELCGRALYLRGGEAVYCGPAKEAVKRLIAGSGAR
jgi:lipopolysaccharide transport system ATP-binding protein